MSDNNSSSGGSGFAGFLLIAFIVLKLCGVINWSWWWVLSPIWITIGLAAIILGAMGIYTYYERKKIVNRRGELKSEWRQRMEELQESNKRLEELKDGSK